MKPMLPNLSLKKEGPASRNRLAVGVVFLLMTALASADLLEVAPQFAALVRHPLFSFYHETHDLLALIVALYAAHRLGPTIGQWAVAWFLALHVPYFYLTLPTELPELARFALLVLVALFSVRIITLHHRLVGQLNSLAATLETQRAAEARRAQEADTLRQAGAAVAATLLPNEAIGRILEQLTHVIPYDSASVQLWAEDPDHPGKGYLEIVGGRGWPDPAAVVGLRFPVPDDNPNTIVIQQRQPYILGDAPSAHAPFRGDPHRHIHSWLGVPLIVHARVIGMLAVDSTRPHSFTPDQARLVSAFADQVAIAIENARLVEAERKRLAELTVLYTLATVGVEATDADTLIQHAIQIIGDILHPDYFGVGLVDDAAGVLSVCRSTRSAPSERLTVPLGRGVAGQVVATGAPRRIPDVSREPVYLPVNLGTRSELCVPLVAAQRRNNSVNGPAPASDGQRVIGVINVESTRPNAFSEADERLMTAFAAQLATAIEKVRLFQAEQRRREVAAALLEIAQVAGSSLELREVLKHTAQQTAKACRANRCSIFLLDDTGELLRPVMSQFADGHADFEQWRTFKAITADRVEAVPLFRDTVRERRPSLLSEAAYTDLVPLKWTQPFGIQKLLAVPLVSRDRVIGLMALDHTEASRAFTPEQIDLALTVGGQVAASIENAQLYAQAQQRLDELRRLHQAGQALNADLSFEAVLNAVADHLIAALEVESCTISSWDTAHNEIVTLLDRDPELAVQVPPGSRFRLSDYPHYSILLQESRPLTFQRDDSSLDERLRQWLDLYLWRSLLTVPLLNRGQVIGLIELGERRHKRGFTADERRLAESLASQAAVAIENARLFEEVQRLAVTDELTGLRNRRSFFESAEHEFERARRYGHPLSVLMLDIDHFKRVNDTYGHAVGDEILRALAGRCRYNVREIDLLGRYGGEEFVALLVESDLNSARNAAERLRRCVAETPMDTGRGPLTVTISLGAAALTEDCTDLAALLHRADAALYVAKKAGRNRVEIMK